MLVTGGTGFVGSAVVRRLLHSGFKVRVLVRPDSPNRKNLEGLDVELAEGDISVRETLAKAMSGCGAVFHLAADYRLWVPKPESMYRANVDASRWIIEDAVAAGVDRIIYCSSVATLGIEQSGDPANEQTPSTIDDMVGHYKRSKFLGEEAARQAAQETSAPVVFVNPSAPIGPRDIRPTPTGRMVLDALLGNMPAYIDTGLNVVHVDDVAEGVLLAYEKGQIGERYILGGENLTLRQIFADLADISGCKAPSIRLNPSLLTPIAWVSEKTARITGQEPRIHMDVLRMARKRMFFSSAKAEKELGYKSRPACEALSAAADWFRQNGYCR